jgi:hypothetical protein
MIDVLKIGVPLGALMGLLLAAEPLPAQNRVPCWTVPNGAAFTTQCANGWFMSLMPDGTVVEGVLTDPTATNPGSTIPMDDKGNVINRGAVQAPPPNQNNAAPGSWYYYGGQPPQ